MKTYQIKSLDNFNVFFSFSVSLLAMAKSYANGPPPLLPPPTEPNEGELTKFQMRIELNGIMFLSVLDIFQRTAAVSAVVVDVAIRFVLLSLFCLRLEEI